MEGPKFNQNEQTYDSLRQNPEEEILKRFNEEEQKEILRKKNILSSLAYFIGKDFEMPIELNQPGAGWHWDFQKNVIRVDPKTLLTEPIELLRYLICHEGGHRRVSRTDFIPIETWRQPGFSAMMNFIEDPRNDNFVSESYPKYDENIKFAWDDFFAKREKEKKEATEKLGFQPRFVQAGYEYIRQWFREKQGQNFEISEDLPEEVKAVVLATLKSAQDSWWRYPSREEADESEEKIKEYAKVSYEINLEEIWPEFKKLVEADKEDEKMEEVLKDVMKKMMEEMKKEQERENGKEGGDGQKDNGNQEGESEDKKNEKKSKLPKDLEDKLTEEEKKTLENAIDKAIDEAKKEKEKIKPMSTGGQGEDKITNKPTPHEDNTGNEQPQTLDDIGARTINLNDLSDEIKQKIRDYVDSLPEDVKKELADRAEKALKEFEDKLNEEMEGKLTENPEEKAERKNPEPPENLPGVEINNQNQGGAPVRTGTLRKEPLDLEGLRIYKERLKREVNKDENIYEKHRREVSSLIDELENKLRQIFVDTQTTRWKKGFRIGKRIDIKTRIQEKARRISPIESNAWQKREKPDEKEYSISILNDLSGSMRKKIEEDFKAKVVLAEALNKLGLNVEINGFNDDIYEYQKFGEPMSKKIREHMGGMFKEVEDSCCKNCGNEHNETDIGWAMETASARLAKQKTDNKIMIVFSDDRPAESTKHPGSKYDFQKIKGKIEKAGGVKLIYYPLKSDNIKVDKIIKDISEILEKEVVG